MDPYTIDSLLCSSGPGQPVNLGSDLNNGNGSWRGSFGRNGLSNGVMGVGGILNKRRPKTGNFLSERGRASEHLGPSVVNTLLVAQVPTQASLDM
jgi:hypothetical protein